MSLLGNGVEQTEPRDLVDFNQGGLQLLLGRRGEPDWERREDRVLLILAGTDDEGELELVFVRFVRFLEAADFFGLRALPGV
jgi:hypothetical protein